MINESFHNERTLLRFKFDFLVPRGEKEGERKRGEHTASVVAVIGLLESCEASNSQQLNCFVTMVASPSEIVSKITCRRRNYTAYCSTIANRNWLQFYCR